MLQELSMEVVKLPRHLTVESRGQYDESRGQYDEPGVSQSPQQPEAVVASLS